MTAVLSFPGGAVDASAFRSDEAPTQTTRLCLSGRHKVDERGNCQFCEAEACNADLLANFNRRQQREQEALAALTESESLLLHVLRKSRSGYWRAHADAARAEVTRAINSLREQGFEDSFPTKEGAR